MKEKLPLTFALLFIALGFLSNFNAKAQSNNDLGISFTSPPQIVCGMTSGSLNGPLSVTVHNYGSTAQTAFPVEYRIYPNVWTTTTIVGTPVAPNSNITYTLTQQLYVSTPGTYMIIARLYPDSNPSNDADTIYITNSNMPQGNVNLGFNLPNNGTDVLRKVTNANSAITQSATANNGPIGTGGLIMDGIDSPNWVTPGTTNPWTSNLAHFSAAYICFNPDSGKVNDTLRMAFDLKQLYKTDHNNTNFRITVNGQQIGNTFTPPVGGYNGGSAPWNRVTLDFSSFIGSPSIEIGLESSVKEGYDNGNGTANLIDNMEIERIAARRGGTGMQESTLQKQLAIFPNPSAGLFQLSLPENQTYLMEVTDLTGKVILKQTSKNKESQLDLHGTPSGIYLLKISGKEGIAVRKLIVE